MVNKNKILLILIFTFTILFQGRNFFTPPFNAYDWRQWDTFAVIRNFRIEGMNILSPRTNQIYVEQNKPDERLFLLDFPIYSYLGAILSYPFGVGHIPGRIINIISAGLVSIVLFEIIRDLKYGKLTATLAVIFLNLSPLFQFSVVSIQPDMLMFLFFSLTFEAFLFSKENNWRTIVFLTLATLIKPYIFLIFLPLIIYKFIKLKDKKYFHYIIPPLLYSLWILRGYFSESGRYWYSTQSWVITFINSWGFDISNISIGFSKRLILSIIALPLFLLSIYGIKKLDKDLKTKFTLIFTGFLAFFLLFLPGNYNHIYYQLPFLLPICILSMIGLSKLFLEKKWVFLILVALTIPSYFLNSKALYTYLFKQHDIYLKLDGWQFEQNVIPEGKTLLYYNDEKSPVLLNMMGRNGWIYQIMDETCDTQKQKIENLNPDYSLVFSSYINRENIEVVSDDLEVIKCLRELTKTEPVYKGLGITVFKLKD